ncbi:MAG: hypothetical protein ACREA9_19230 [Pyrinomonadaceae bacterium]
MSIEIDVRTDPATGVDTIRYSPSFVLFSNLTQIGCTDSTGAQYIIVNKADAKNLIKALQMAVKVWP